MEEHTSISWKKYGQIAGGVVLGGMVLICLLVLMLRWANPPFTAFTLQENWEELGKERYNLRETWIPGEDLPSHLKLALIASEDQRFYDHWGLDLMAIEDAMEEKEQSGRVRGASTITQQVAKNFFLSPAQNYIRKGVEAVIAVLIDLFWPKERILEVYFNIAEFGPGMFGVSRATDFYYEKPASALTPRESARMVTVLPNPKIIEPEPPSDYVLNRSEWILRNMQQLSGVRYLPKPDTTDSLQNIEMQPDSLFLLNFPDTQNMGISDLDSLFSGPDLDTVLMKIDMDSVNY